MRGAQSHRQTFRLGTGIIPADAGSTKDYVTYDEMRRDHPRGCGEHMKWRIPYLMLMGSSPRMRGARQLSSSKMRKGRIIPADAGSTRCIVSRLMSIGDHPRGCGEHHAKRASINRDRGSSPRMRGAQDVLLEEHVARRIIPADAGSTCFWHKSFVPGKDHPRGCGEHSKAPRLHSLHRGSSPRMRGAPLGLRAAEHPRRIIPADAGSTT